MRKINPGVCAAIFVMIFSLVFLFQSLKFEYTSPSGPGPGFFPSWLSGILFILSLFYIYESIRSGKGSFEGIFPQGGSYKNILVTAALMILFIILLSFAGFVLSGTIFLFLLLYRAYRWYVNFGISLGVTIFFFWLFGSVLNVTLPVNGLGF